MKFNLFYKAANGEIADTECIADRIPSIGEKIFVVLGENPLADDNKGEYRKVISVEWKLAPIEVSPTPTYHALVTTQL